MHRNLLVVLTALLLCQQVAASPSTSREAHAAFREAVEDYQMFVVPHCAPETVRAYVTAKAERDGAFLRSLRNTPLYAEYKKAVADRAARDRRTVYECIGPPPPPPGSAPSQPSVMQEKPSAADILSEHFAAGDRQFETMVHLRDALLASEGK